MEKQKSNAGKAGIVGAGLALAAGNAAAAPAAIDVTEVVSAIAATLGPIGLIGGGVLLVLVGIKTYKWVRRAM